MVRRFHLSWVMPPARACATVRWQRLFPTALPPADKEQEMADQTPVLDTLADITLASLERSTLEPRELMLARIAALVAVGAPPASYLLNVGTAADSGITMEDVQGLLVAVAPIVGTPRTVAAAGDITRALGFAIALESELEARAQEPATAG
jgi:alkylhydroperoxidase/carboxymuconolactone decarboxylase family protein YurZ